MSKEASVLARHLKTKEVGRSGNAQNQKYVCTHARTRVVLRGREHVLVRGVVPDYQHEVRLLPVLLHARQHAVQERALVHARRPDLDVPALQ